MMKRWGYWWLYGLIGITIVFFIYNTVQKKAYPAKPSPMEQIFENLGRINPLLKSIFKGASINDTSGRDKRQVVQQNKPVVQTAGNRGIPPPVFWGYLKLEAVTFYGFNHYFNRAVIKNLLDGTQNLYPQGVDLPYGCKLAQIFKDRIILEKDGITRSLKLASKVDDPAARKHLQETGYQQVNGNEWLIRPSRLLKDNKHIEKILTELEISSFPDSKGIQRFQVNKLQKNALLEELGFKNEDLIKTVNGKNVSTFADLLSAYLQVKQSSEITISLERNRSVIKLTYHMTSDESPAYNIENILRESQTVKLFN